MSVLTWERDPFNISTDKAKLDLNMIHDFLVNTYWGKNRSFTAQQLSIANSLCFGLYENTKQIGFARVLTDYATIAYIFDVFVLASHQHQGLGNWLIETIIHCPPIEKLSFALATKDQHSFYKKLGFMAHPDPERIMVLNRK